MIQKSALTSLTQSEALLRFDEARKIRGVVVEMIEQDDGLWTVTMVWDDAGRSGATLRSDEGEPVRFSDLSAFDEVGGAAPDVAPQAAQGQDLGSLSRRFESNGRPGAIGFDSAGGFSYGAYQIASRTGTMATFLAFLSSRFPVLSGPLEDAGGAVAAKAGTDAFKSAWQQLAANPDFGKAQHDFIAATHYEPFARVLAGPPLRLDLSMRTPVLRDVAWSVAVQHGAANRVFANALSSGIDVLSDREIIERVYDERSDVDKYFPSSSAKIKAALRNRFAEERHLALGRLTTM